MRFMLFNVKNIFHCDFLLYRRAPNLCCCIGCRKKNFRELHRSYKISSVELHFVWKNKSWTKFNRSWVGKSFYVHFQVQGKSFYVHFQVPWTCVCISKCEKTLIKIIFKTCSRASNLLIRLWPWNIVWNYFHSVRIIIYFFITCTFGKGSKVIGPRPLLELGTK